MSTLVIAEKPSVAKSIAAVLGASTRKDGYLEGGGYIVSWCIGHLVALAEATAYDERYAKWEHKDLPILPQQWRNSILPKTKKQYDVLRRLMNSADVSTIVCATDAGREGELIFRLVYEMTGCKKPIERLWISSMEESAIRQGFQNLKPGAEYDRLYQAALCRSRADWLVGINATRLFSTLYHRTLNVGRVMTPTLALIVQREAEIDAFAPTPFYTVTVALSDFSVSSERMEDKAQAEALQDACIGADCATVKTVERKEKAEKAPALYDLTTLQREANRLLGYTAQQTLDYLQSLYEKKLCTYPRTDNRYLTSDMADSLPMLLNRVAKKFGIHPGFDILSHARQVIDDSKVSDHHAVIPTVSVFDADLEALPKGERAVLELVANRLICAVSQPYEYAETTVVVDCAGHDFTAKGRAILNPGWKNLDSKYKATLKNKPEPDKDSEAKALPIVTNGQQFGVVVAAVKEGKTSPPKHFTEDSLLAAMETAGAKETPADAERKGLGTPATRAAILEKLVTVGFVERKKSKKTVNLMPTPEGIALITVVPEQIQSPSMTAEWEHQLGQIERGEADADSFISGIAAMLTDLTRTYEPIPGADVLFPSKYESVGKCPRCGSRIADTQKGFFCERHDCKFAIWKDNKFFAMKKKKLTTDIVAALLSDGRVKLTGLHSEKTGKTYDAVVVMEDTGTFVNFKLEFEGGNKRG
ncbi:DNA topoisomerase 3 [Christensenellaceae bacterium OttesenSCG-928-M15]|nr:DNA topoisomerase 3 [Christensenellaceae bacterium OttesenSCG-928-M15]